MQHILEVLIKVRTFEAKISDSSFKILRIQVLELKIQMTDIGICTFNKDSISNRTAAVTGFHPDGYQEQRIQEMGLKIPLTS